MSEKTDQDGFEARLGRVERRGLPEAWRDEILGNACGVKRVGVFGRTWASLPKVVAMPVAAAWVAVAVLKATMPGGTDREPTGVVQQETRQLAEREMFVSWVVEKKRLGGGDLILGDRAEEGKEL